MNSWFKSGSPWVWLSAGGVSISLISVLGLLWLIASRGLSYFWPADIYQFETVNEKGQAVTIIGEIYDRESLPTKQLSHLNLGLDPNKETIERILVKTGNRELVNLDFRWLLVPLINKTTKPEDLVVIERRTNGNFYGYVEGIILDGKPESLDKMDELVDRVDVFQDEMDELQKVDIGAINYQIERLRLKKRKHILDETITVINKTIKTVPNIAGNTPPSVFASRGSSTKKLPIC